MRRVDPARLDLARAFKNAPLGPHAAELEDLLRVLRWAPSTERYLAVQVERDGPWCVGRSNGGRGVPLTLWRRQRYMTPAAAAWAVFQARWFEATGAVLLLDADDVDPLSGPASSSEGLVSRPLLGYADRISVRPGETIEFKVSCTTPGGYQAALQRVRCGDRVNIGLRVSPVDSPLNGTYPGRVQAIRPGSHAEIGAAETFSLASFSLQASVWPTLPGHGEQAIIATLDTEQHGGYALLLDGDGALALRLGDGRRWHTVSTGVALLERHWYQVAASYDAESGTVELLQRPLRRHVLGDGEARQRHHIDASARHGAGLRLAAWHGAGGHAEAHYNGKLEAPCVVARALRPAELAALVDTGQGAPVTDALVARWDFSRSMSGTHIEDVGPCGLHGELLNMPTRAMKGRHWDASAFDWRQRPEHYAAIHFHDDDLHDCAWDSDFSLCVPDDLPSGLYCAHLSCAQGEDRIPFVVSPPRGTARAALAVLLPTASYWAYANRHTVIDFPGREHVRSAFTSVDPTGLYLHHHPDLGLSMYDAHSDGSGVCLSSRLRPILNLRPDEALWQLPADTHVLDWLEAMAIPHDVITEDDLDREGLGLLAPYRCVMTGTHPEYPSLAMLEAIDAYQQQGGRFIYLGGNGFYWRVSYHPQLPGLMEMRRAEDGIRAWEAEGGEYHHACTGELGGMWRRMGRAPQSVAGTGMTAQGFDRSTYFLRTPESHDARVAFAFAGIGADERIGDFGILGGGAAGWEIDRADAALGTPPHALVVAHADTFGSGYHWMKEELTHTHAAITGETCPHVHCDMVFYETPGGGAVFAFSSIAWAAALAHADYRNNVSLLTENVVRRFIDPAPIQAPSQPAHSPMTS